MSKRRSPRVVLSWCWLALSLASCVGGDTGTETERAACGVRTATTPVDADATTARGTARALAQGAMLESEVTIAYQSIVGDAAVQRATKGRVRVLPDLSTARVDTFKDRYSELMVCADGLEMDAVIELESVDGAFRERFQGSVGGDTQATTLQLSAEAQKEFSERIGSYDTEAFSKAKRRVLSIRLHLQHDAQSEGEAPKARWSGQLTLEAPGVKDAVSAAVAEW